MVQEIIDVAFFNLSEKRDFVSSVKKIVDSKGITLDILN